MPGQPLQWKIAGPPRGKTVTSSFLSDALSRNDELVLPAADERYQLMVTGSGHDFYYVRDSKGRVKYVSPSVKNVLGFRASELVGSRFPPHSGRDGSIPDVAMERSGASSPAGHSGHPHAVVLKHKTGCPITIEIIEKALVRGGKVIGVHGFARDMTARYEAERRLVYRSTYLNALIEHSPFGIVVLDDQHHVRMCNAAFERIFQYQHKEMVGKSIDTLISTASSECQVRDLTRQVLSGHSVHTVGRRRRKDGQCVDVEIYGVPLMISGRLVGVYGIYQDITDVRRTADSLRRLTGQLLNAQDEERRRIARELHDSTGQSLVALTMSLSRLYHSSAELDTQDRHLLLESVKVAEQCAKELRTLSYLLHPPLLDEMGLRSAIELYVSGFSARSGIKVILHLPAELEPFPREAELALYRVVQESLANVYRHSGCSAVTVSLRVLERSIELTIRDRGRGLPIARQRARKVIGMGIGDMQERLEQLGGRLQIKSEKGTVVKAYLPLRNQNC
jgi:two-component system, NarL family, sensor kinase